MLHQKERIKLVNLVAELRALGLLNIEGGGISIRLDDGTIIVTPTGGAFRRWHVIPEDILVTNVEGKILERGKYLAAAEFPLDLHIFKNFELCNAVFHNHGPFSLAFASLGKAVPHVTNHIEVLGKVPCLSSPNETKLKQEYLANPKPVDMPEAVVQRPEVYVVFEQLMRKVDETLLTRKGELTQHGLAFTVEKHGLFSLARSIDEAIENAVRVEAAARTAIYSSLVVEGWKW